MALPKRISVTGALPLTPVGKIFKPALRREAIVWAIEAAASEAGLQSGDLTVEVGETLDTMVMVPNARLESLKEALTGMPLTLTIVAAEGV